MGSTGVRDSYITSQVTDRLYNRGDVSPVGGQVDAVHEAGGGRAAGLVTGGAGGPGCRV